MERGNCLSVKEGIGTTTVVLFYISIVGLGGG